MAYNYNPNFSKHMEISKSNTKFLKQLRNNENFNYKPKTSVEEGVSIFVDWYLKYIKLVK